MLGSALSPNNTPIFPAGHHRGTASAKLRFPRPRRSIAQQNNEASWVRLPAIHLKNQEQKTFTTTASSSFFSSPERSDKHSLSPPHLDMRSTDLGWACIRLSGSLHCFKDKQKGRHDRPGPDMLSETDRRWRGFGMFSALLQAGQFCDLDLFLRQSSPAQPASGRGPDSSRGVIGVLFAARAGPRTTQSPEPTGLEVSPT